MLLANKLPNSLCRNFGLGKSALTGSVVYWLTTFIPRQCLASMLPSAGIPGMQEEL